MSGAKGAIWNRLATALLPLILVISVGCQSECDRFEIEPRTPISAAQFGEAVNGIAVGLSYERIGECGMHRLLVHLKNVGDKPVTLPPPRSGSWGGEAFVIRINGEPKQPSMSAFMTLDSFWCQGYRSAADQFLVLEPGGTTTAEARYQPWLEGGQKSADVSITYVYENRWTELFVPIEQYAIGSPMARIGPLWTGKAISGPVELTLKRTE